MQVPLIDLKAQYSAIRDEIEAAIREVSESQYFVLGPKVEEFERRIAEYSEVSHAIGVSSGTDALLVALMALDIGPGDEVLTTPYSFFATAGTIARLGARPLFCDIDARTFNLDPAAVAELLGEQCDRVGADLVNRRTGGRIRAILPVHLFGQMADMDALVDIARRHELPIAEDAAQAIGAELGDGRRAGGVGAIGCFSFFPTKNLGAFGDAGMCVANDAELAERIRKLRVHGGRTKYLHDEVGGNFRLDELQAAILLVKLDHLDRWTQSRQDNAARYRQLFDEAQIGEYVTPPPATGGRHIFNQYVIRAERRDELRSWLAEHEIRTEIYYPLALHEQACFADLGHAADDFPNARRAAAESLALPVYPELSSEQIEYVVSRIAAFYRLTPRRLRTRTNAPSTRSRRERTETRQLDEPSARESRRTLFDAHIVVDWSAASKPTGPTPCENAIWWAIARDGDVEPPKYARTRHQTIQELVQLISSEIERSRRVLVGFDFPFGYPAGVAAHVTQRDDAEALDLWDWLGERISDSEDNSNNRFAVASELNRGYPGKGPFWGRPSEWDYPDIPTRARDRTADGGAHPPDKRVADSRAKGAKSVWQLYYAGSVGSQVILGLPAINRIRQDYFLGPHTAVWPFDTGLRVPEREEGSRLVVAEVYPSLLKEAVNESLRDDETITDRAQVRVNAVAFATLDAHGGLAALFRGTEALTSRERQSIEREEGWILGLGHEQALKNTLRSP